jgi:hypothetical protein
LLPERSFLIFAWLSPLPYAKRLAVATGEKTCRRQNLFSALSLALGFALALAFGLAAMIFATRLRRVGRMPLGLAFAFGLALWFAFRTTALAFVSAFSLPLPFPLPLPFC